MAIFISKVLKDLITKNHDPSSCIFVLPNKRAGTFLKNEYAKLAATPQFAPIIFSIEEFVASISHLKKIATEEVLLTFYETYSQIEDADRKSLDEFLNWAETLIQDFNEIDRFLISAKSILTYLSQIKELDHWSLDNNQTSLIKEYLKFWQKVPQYYEHLTTALIENGIGYQGLVYREAIEHLDSYIQHVSSHHVFVGFNALNKSEATIIQELLQSGNASIYWDISEEFLNNTNHDAGFFIRDYLKDWSYFEQHSFLWKGNSYSTEKDIHAVATVKHVAQVKYVGAIIHEIQKHNPDLNDVAIILADENLLLPLLHSLPATIPHINVTMGLPLKQLPLVDLIQKLLQLHKKNSNSFYFKDVLAILNHPVIVNTLIIDEAIQKVNTYIAKNNFSFITLAKLIYMLPKHEDSLKLLFESWGDSIDVALQKIGDLILNLQASYNSQERGKNSLDKEFAYRCYTIINSLQDIVNRYKSIKTLETLQRFFDDFVARETLDFKGEPLRGLQIMGMLESRVLDFETVILVSVNEGVLPAGKSHNSYLPYHIKREYNLPTYAEKDAVYAYHFYRLIQHAKTVYLIYNAEPDTLNGGEQSRFIRQIENEGLHRINHLLVNPEVTPNLITLKQVEKTSDIVSIIKQRFAKGISPSALLTYVRNPIDYYHQYVLGIKEVEEVEETVAANTLGTIVHESLKLLYLPYINQLLTVENLKDISSKANTIIEEQFKIYFREGNHLKGKNLIIFEVAMRYVHNFISAETEIVNKGNQIKIIALEIDEQTILTIPEINEVITIKGQIDRIDEFNGTTRIIDYKTGKVDTSQVSLHDWQLLTSDYKKYGKSFQVLFYSYMLYKNRRLTFPVEAGILSFKNLKSGFLKFGMKENATTRKRDTLITEETMKYFESELKILLVELLNPTIPFVEKEV